MLEKIQTADIDSINALDILKYIPSATYSVVSDITLPEFIENGRLEGKDVFFYRVNRLSFDEDYPRREAFENVLLSLDSTAFNFVYVLSGSADGVELYFGIVKNAVDFEASDGKRLTARDYGAMLGGAFTGNFGGSEVTRIRGDILNREILSAAADYENAGMIVGVPSENSQNENGKGFQGMDRLINSMLGLNWRLIVVAEPADKRDIAAWQQEIYNIYDAIAPFAKSSLQRSDSEGISHSEGGSVSDGKSYSVSLGNGSSEGASYTKQRGESGGESSSTKKRSSTSGWSNSESFGKNSGRSSNLSFGISSNITKGENWSDGVNIGRSYSMTAELINKNAQDMLKYIDEELLPRIKSGFGRGMFKTSVYYMADNPSTSNRLRTGIISLFQGSTSSYSPLSAYKLDLADRNAVQALMSFQNVSTPGYEADPYQLSLLSRPHMDGQVGLNTWLTPSEVSMLAGLPQKEIPGLSVVEGVDFGLNVCTEGEITLGCLIQKGRELESMPLRLSKNFVNKHTFIAGVTGTGKTTTCHKLLKEAGAPFLVIEPAKTEYRTLIGTEGFGNCVVFTVGDEKTAPLRFNPFELVEGEGLSSHIDMLKAAFTSAFPMEGSMPQLLEEAVYKCYEDKGWNVDTDKNDVIAGNPDYEEGDEFTDKYDAFPILSDFLEALQDVVKEKNFGDRLGSEYLGSLVSRFSNLRKGVKGRMLNTPHSIDFDKIADSNVIIELENLKSAEDKALIIGFILARMSAVIRKKHRENNAYRHITLVEEAHRLLSKVEYGDGGAKKSAVEAFTDLLAEVRKYGEGLVIVDQIPNKLASEVIKNTNTKIIHKILASDDKETVGDAMLMDDKQKNFLSALGTGEAVVFTEGMLKPVHIKVKRVTDTNEAEIFDDVVRKKYVSWMAKTHPRILVESIVVSELYSEFNRRLIQCVKAEGSGGAGSDLYNRIAAFQEQFKQKYDVEALPPGVLSAERICWLLVNEKSKRMHQNNAFRKRLNVFVMRCLLGRTNIEELGEIQSEALKKLIRESGMSV